MKPIFIEATTIPDAWFQCLYTLIEESRKPDGAARRYTVDTGSNPGADRIEFDMAMIHIRQPGRGPCCLKSRSILICPLWPMRNIWLSTCLTCSRPRKPQESIILMENDYRSPGST